MGLSPEKMHLTIAHDKTGIPDYVASDDIFDIEFTGEIELMGEGEDRGLCLFVDSPALQMRHGELEGMGAQHKFLDYRPHITVKYEPLETDLELARAAFDSMPFKKLSVGGETIQLIK